MSKYWQKPEYIALAISALAVGVSLFGPISSTLAKSNLIIDLPGSLTMGTNLGHFSIRPAVSIVNTGSAIGEFSRIECSMKEKSTGMEVELSGETIQTPDGASPPINTSALTPGEEFYNFINCLVVPSDDEIDRHTALIREAGANVLSNGLQNCNQQYTASAVELSPFMVGKLKNYFNEKFNVQPGKYILTISAYNSSDLLVATQSTHMTISEAAIVEMRKASDEYKFGHGVVCPATQVGTVSVRLSQSG